MANGSDSTSCVVIRIGSPKRTVTLPRMRGNPRDARLAPVQASVRRARSFRVDPEQSLAAEHAEPGFERLLRLRRVVALHRNLSDEIEEPARLPRLPVLGLGQIRDTP